MKIVTISDTHAMERSLVVPEGDVLIHAGDFSGRGSLSDLEDFLEWYNDLPHKHKILIAGNHDWCFADVRREEAIAMTSQVCTYLEDSSVTIDGVKFYGSPWQPEFYDWAFQLPRGPDLAEIWAKIETDTDVLITHGPPHKILDFCPGGHVGDEDLLAAVLKLPQLKYHIFGHIHEGYGIEKFLDVTYINASNCTGKYVPSNQPIVFDIA